MLIDFTCNKKPYLRKLKKNMQALIIELTYLKIKNHEKRYSPG